MVAKRKTSDIANIVVVGRQGSATATLLDVCARWGGRGDSCAPSHWISLWLLFMFI
jgi:hypothetical protein